MAYILEITSAALRQAKKLPKNVRQAIVQKSEGLSKNPLIGEKLRGKYSFLRSFHFSFKGTQYRVIYETDHRLKKIYVRLVDSRENLYRNLDKMKLKPLS